MAINVDELTKQGRTPKTTTPSWLKQASKGNGRCKHCRTEYLKAELNASGNCHHCADELGQPHPFNS